MKIDLNTLVNDREMFIKALYDETDIGCVLISLNYLELCLRYLITDYFSKNPSKIDKIFEVYGSLNTYMNKLELAKKLNLLTKNNYEDMKRLGQIRNKFAHSHKAVRFNDKNIIKMCNELKSCNNSLPPHMLKLDNLTREETYKHTKLRFIDTIINITNEILVGGLLSRILHKSV